MRNGDFITTDWKVLPRGDTPAHWSGLYVTMNPKGSIAISQVTHERLGAPEALLIMYDAMHNRMALKPARVGEPNAYPVRKHGRGGGRIIRAYRLVTFFGIQPVDTIEFLEPKLDPDGFLVLDLRKIRISPRSHSQCRAKIVSD